MGNVNATTSNQIRTELAKNVASARAYGYDGTDAEYEHTAQDCEAVVAAIGRKPTREEWSDAGLGWVGNAHVEENA